jgi:hypothetical protein
MTSRPLQMTHPDELPVPSIDEVSELVTHEAIDQIAKLRPLLARRRCMTSSVSATSRSTSSVSATPR